VKVIGDSGDCPELWSWDVGEGVEVEVVYYVEGVVGNRLKNI
jgi:hypothetical protein